MSDGDHSEGFLARLHESCRDVVERQEKTYTSGLKVIDKLISKLSKAKSRLAKADSYNVAQKLCETVLQEKPHSILSREFKELHNVVVKLGKTVDKNLQSDASIIDGDSSPAFPSNSLTKAIVHSLLRQGRVSVAEQLMKEHNLEKLPAEAALREMNVCSKALLARNVQPALQWALNEERGGNKHAWGLRQDIRDLRFRLLNLRYMQFLEGGESGFLEAISFAQKHLAEFTTDRQKDIERLAGSLLFSGNLSNSPYQDLCSEKAWLRTKQGFESIFCKCRGLAGKDPLLVATLASNIALPKRLKYTSVLRNGGRFLEAKDRALLEVNLGKNMQFHSTFVCPISKDQATIGNPPVLLECGHVISKEAMSKIVRTRRTGRVKCPTCPTETLSSNVSVLKF